MPTMFGYSRPSASLPDPADHKRRLAAAGAERIYVERTAARAPRAMPQRRKLLIEIEPGDTLILTSLDRLGTHFDDMVRCFALLVERGMRLRILEPEFEITQPCPTPYHDLLAVLKTASTSLHSDTIKLHLAAARAAGGKPAGKTPLLADDMWPDIKARIETTPIEALAADLGVSRQTLWTFRRRMEKTTSAPPGRAKPRRSEPESVVAPS